MNEDIRYFYMWVHPYTQKTCYGVTDTLSRRKRNYQGHNGFDITWNFIARGSSDDIEKLEGTLKKKVALVEQDLGRKISYGKYEWIEAEVEYSTIEALIDNFLEEDNYDSVTIIKSGNVENNVEYDDDEEDEEVDNSH